MSEFDFENFEVLDHEPGEEPDKPEPSGGVRVPKDPDKPNRGGGTSKNLPRGEVITEMMGL